MVIELSLKGTLPVIPWHTKKNQGFSGLNTLILRQIGMLECLQFVIDVVWGMLIEQVFVKEIN